MVDDVDRCDDIVFIEGDEVFEDGLDQRQVDRRSVETGEGGDPNECPFELPDVGRHLRCHVFQDFRADLEFFALCFLTQDGDAGFEVWGLHVGDEPPLEPRPHPVFEPGEVFWRQVARDDDLFIMVVQRIEGMEERLLGLDRSLEKLDVVDQEDVNFAIAGLEGR